MTDYRTDPSYVETSSRIDKIEVTLSHAVDAIEKLAAVVNRPQRTQWGPILTAVGLLFVAGGGYTTLVTQPLADSKQHLRAQIIELEKEARDEHIQIAGQIGELKGRLDTLKEIRQNEARRSE